MLLVGFVILITSGKYLVKASVSIALRYKLSKLVVGLTIVSFGTSAPELFVSVLAAIDNHPGISVGNIVGSNIINIALVLALTAIVFPIKVNRKSIIYDWLMMMLSSILFYIFIFDGYLQFFEGVAFFLLLCGYVIISIHASRKNYLQREEKVEPVSYSPVVAIIVVILASAGLALGSKLLVNNAVIIAEKIPVDERIISITLIAFGTSIPELVTSVAAAYKKEMEISVGNIIGSNIFNLLGVLGITAMIKKIKIPELTTSSDVYWMLGVALLLLLFMIPLRHGIITRGKGVALFMIYCIYVYLLFTQI